MYDGQLLELTASIHDLTEMGKTVLRDEMRKRGLGDPLTPGWSARQHIEEHEKEALEAAEADAADKPFEYTWKVELCGCNDSVEARQIGETLKRAGIPCWGNGPSFPADLRGPIILVAADQLDEARAILAQPIPQDILDESRVEIPEYAPPVCPSCGAADPVLLSADPTNSWECEACGKEWSDPIDEPAEG
jgi:hypothetical protein